MSIVSLSQDELTLLKGLLGQTNILNNTVSIASVNMSRGAISCTKAQMNTIRTDSMTSLNSNIVTINDTRLQSNPTTIKTSNVLALDNTGLYIEGMQVSGGSIQIESILGKSGGDVSINDAAIQPGGIIRTNTILPKTGNDVQISNMFIRNEGIQISSISKLGSSVSIEGVTFNDNVISAPSIIADNISGAYNNNINLNTSHTINKVGISSDGDITAKSINVSSIIAPDDTPIEFVGKVGLTIEQLDYGDNGFAVENVILKNGKVYTTELMSLYDFNNPGNNNGVKISGVDVNNGAIDCDSIECDSVNITNFTVHEIYEKVQNEGVNVNGIVMKDRGVMIPAIDILDDSNMQYATLFYSNELQKVFIETPDGESYIPPKTVAWSDWSMLNNDPHVEIIANNDSHSRFSVIDQSCFISLNIRIRTTDTGFNTVWVSLPTDYTSTNNKFTTFAIVDKIQNNVAIPIIGRAYIDGVINKNLLYLELPENYATGVEYIITLSMTYEYEVERVQVSSPWQSWYPVRKDTDIANITVYNTRYYKSGSNMWISFEMDIRFNQYLSSLTKEHTYVSLPPNTHTKRLHYSNPIIITSGTSKYTGIASAGSVHNDNTLDTSNMRLSLVNDYFDQGGVYTFTGQLLFEETSVTPVDFFFERIGIDILTRVQDGSDHQFTLQDMSERSICDMYSENVSNNVVTEYNWSFHIPDNTSQLHVTSNDGFTSYNELSIISSEYYSSEKVPWRFIRNDGIISVQFTIDGKKYNDQLVMEI